MFDFTHISDLHLSPMPPVRWTQLLNKRIIGYLNWRFNRQSVMKSGAFAAVIKHMNNQKTQHLAISGDLVNLALPAEFERAKKTISKLGTPENVSLVFGNHDAYVPGAVAKASKIFTPWITSDKDIKKRSNAPFPYMRIRGEIAIIGVSSAIATLPFFASGFFGKKQAEALTSLLQQAEKQHLFRVVMIHHPPLHHATAWYKTLWGINRFQKIIAEYGAELILHGHTHLSTLSHISGKVNTDGTSINKRVNLKQVPVVGVSSTAQEFGGHKPAAGYNFFSVGKSADNQWICNLKRYGVINPNNSVELLEEKQII